MGTIHIIGNHPAAHDDHGSHHHRHLRINLVFQVNLGQPVPTRSSFNTSSGRETLRIRYDTLDLRVPKKLTNSQLNLLHGPKQKKE